MIKLSKLTDYAITLLSVLYKNKTRSFSASVLAEVTGIPEPTTSKILKQLSASDLVTSTRGVKGGYQVNGDYEDIPLTKVIEIMEGDISLTDCASCITHECANKEICPMDGGWTEINKAVLNTLNSFSLAGVLDKAKTIEIRE
ncbi:MAG: SUF system Fe-S cluster assembly regulator [Pseudomonadota bacterium]|nr:SUF system Fe-S cluster assembly regulator [Alphaproteobacteria bacterium]MEC7703191.1 SUF system Fe-S cluster assembly regulator [Pseudomonadota bacterium]MEC9236668.1 SUF system Fe-S cluster assembly regulator [Pseudomonadota bacterium]MED5423419.1 SUF system Fe-S cluster assembly regulator [Pseudomonadota bacterium]MEE3322884.1 SUF system Fe-S cluster assembly regulator [Pseudomonadota bacterium]